MSLVQNLVNRYKKRQEQRADEEWLQRQQDAEHEAFVHKLLAYAEDGKLTNEEIEDIEKQQVPLGISWEDMNAIKSQTYLAAYNSIRKDGRVTEEEEAELFKIQKYFKISDQDIEPTKRELARFRLLRLIAIGSIPEVSVPNMLFQKGEKAYWSEEGEILEERVVQRRYEGGSHGVSFRIAKGVSYRVGAHKGHIVSDSAIVPVSHGNFVITNKRIVFKGDKKSFSLRYEKILNIEFYTDGVNLSVESGKTKIVQFTGDKDIDIIGSILSYVINNRS